MPSHRRHTLSSLVGCSLAATAALSVALFVPSAAHAAVAERVAVDHGMTAPLTATPASVPATSAFDVVLTPSDPTGLANLVSEVSTPGTAQYRHFLSESQYVARFAPSTATVNAVASYFRAYGLTVTYNRSSPLLVHVSGPSGDVEHAFDTSLRAATTDHVLSTEFSGTATLPSSIASTVTAIDGLSTLTPPESPQLSTRAAAHVAAAPHVTEPGSCSGASDYQVGTGDTSFLPDQQAAAYGLTSEWADGNNGAGETIGIFELANYVSSDVAAYFRCFGLSPSLSVVNVDGGPTATDDQGGTNGPEGEADLDIEESGVLAPGASIIVYQGTQSSDTGVLDTYQAIATADKASVVTTSWGGCEGEQTSNSDIEAENAIFEQMAAQGQSVFAAAGDDGSSDCWNGSTSHSDGTEGLAVDDPASQPDVTGVGGLTVTSIASTDPPSTLRETVWNSGGGAGGGGDSKVWPQPSWQTGDVDGVTLPDTGTRMVPDLSVMADPSTGFIEYSGGTWNGIGGTSIASPIMAAVTATADEACGVRLGMLNPTLYSMAASGTGFDDVTSGSNALFKSTRPNYDAVVGYDRASGLGSPDPTTFIPDLCTTTASPSSSTIAVTPTPSADVATGAVVTVTVRTSDDGPIANATPTVTGTVSGGTVTVTPLTPATNASGVQTFALDATVRGTVNLTVSVGPTVIGTPTVTLTSSVAAAATTLTNLSAASGDLASSYEPTTDFGAAVTVHGTLNQTSADGAALNDTSKFHLGPARGAPAANCASSVCTIAVDDNGVLGVITNATSTSRIFTSLGPVSALAREIAPNSLSVLTDVGGAGGAVTFLTTSGQVVLAAWHGRASTAAFTNLSAKLKVARASGGTSLVASSASQYFVATRVGGDVWMLRAGTSTGSANLDRSAGYVDTGTAAVVGTPALTRDVTSGELEIAARTDGGGLVLFGATTHAPTTITSDDIVARSGVTAVQFTRGSTTTVAARDDLLVLEGAKVVLYVDGPNWTPLAVATLTGVPMSAHSLAVGTAPLVVTATAVDAVSP